MTGQTVGERIGSGIAFAGLSLSAAIVTVGGYDARLLWGLLAFWLLWGKWR